MLHPHSSETAAPGQPAGTPVAAVIGTCLHFVSGVVIWQPFVQLAPGRLPAGWVSLMAAALLIGVGVGYLLQYQFLKRWRRVGAIRLSVMCLAVAVIVAMASTSHWNLLLSCVPAGMGLFGEWTATAGMTRRSLTSTQLWRGMRVYSASWFVGAVAAAIVGNTVFSGEWLVIVLNGICAAFCVIVALVVPRQLVDELYKTIDEDAGIAPTLTEADGNQATNEHSTQADTEVPTQVQSVDECAADECCGGGCEWRPTELWLGICLATIGMLSAGLLLPSLVTHADTTGVVTLVGALLGIVVFQAVVPGTGYAVLLLSCCVLGLLVCGTAGAFGVHWSGLLTTLPAALLSATFCGCSGLIGESFTDAHFQKGRSFVLLLGSLVAAAIAALTAVAVSDSLGRMLNWGLAGIWLTTIFLLRQIPGPVLSQRRQEEISQAEANQILAEAPEILEDTVA